MKVSGQDTLKISFFRESNFSYGQLIYPVEGNYTYSSNPLKPYNYPLGFELIQPAKLSGQNGVLKLTAFSDSVPNYFLKRITPAQHELYTRYADEWNFWKDPTFKNEFLKKNNLFTDTVSVETQNYYGQTEMIQIPVFFEMANYLTDTLTSYRSHLLVSDSLRAEFQSKVSGWLEPFFMKQTEVSNKEYREFIQAVRDSIMISRLYDSLEFDLAKQLLNCSKKQQKALSEKNKSVYRKKFGLNYDYFQQTKEEDQNKPEYIPILTDLYYPQPERYYKRREFDNSKLIYHSRTGAFIPIYPDTACWLNSKNSLHDPYTNMYNWHPAYDNYPVVGLNLIQMQAYCEWYEQKLNKSRKDSSVHFSVSIPELYQYEMAAKRVAPRAFVNELSVDPPEALSYMRSEEDASFHVQKVHTIISLENGYSPSFKKLLNWQKANATFPIFQLLGNVSEVCLMQEDDPQFMTILGGDRYLGLVDPTEVQLNTLFYKRKIPAMQGSSTVGFRTVIRLK
jgi:hypothetical protein